MRLHIKILVILLLAQQAFGSGAMLDTNMTAYSAMPLEGGTQNVVTNGSGVYNFADKNGDGNTNDPVSPVGLNMRNFNITAAGTVNPLKINLNGAWLYGNSGIFVLGGSSLSLQNMAFIDMTNGYITSSAGESLGVTIGSPTNPVGNIRMRHVAVTAGFGLTNTDFLISSTGSVTCMDSGLTLRQLTFSGGAVGVGAIRINHDGNFSASFVSNAVDAGGIGGGVYLNGDSLGNGYSGTLTVNDKIFTSCRDLVWGAHATKCGNIAISNYASVIVGSLAAKDLTGGTSGNVQISQVNNIIIGGSIDLRNYNPLANGGVDLVPTVSTAFNNLDLSLVRRVTLWSGTGHYILGTIYGTNGLPASNFASFKDYLRAPVGQIVYYVTSANTNLGGATITLTNATATAQGGILTPYVAPSTAVRNLKIPSIGSRIEYRNIFWP